MGATFQNRMLRRISGPKKEGDEVKEDEMGGSHSMRRRDVKYGQNFGQKTLRTRPLGRPRCT
jgi:hypothetical protein